MHPRGSITFKSCKFSTSSMVVFSFSDITEMIIDSEIPHKVDYINTIINEVPIGQLKTESIEERQDKIDKLFSQMPRYTMSGDQVNFQFGSEKFTIRIGEPTVPKELEEIIEQKEVREETFSKDFLNKISIDTNYLIGIINKYIGPKPITNISGLIRSRKSEDNYISYSNIINNKILNKIGENMQISGIVIENEEDKDEWKIYIRDGKGELNITMWYNFVLNGPIDLFELLEKYITKINTIILTI